MRDLRYAATAGFGLRATGHTASDQVETVLYRLVSSGSTRGIKARREDGVVRPLLDVWREDTEAYCAEHGLGNRSLRDIAGVRNEAGNVFGLMPHPEHAVEPLLGGEGAM